MGIFRIRMIDDLFIVLKCLADISAEEVSKFAVNFSTSCSCVIKIVEHRARATLDDLKTSVLKVNTLERERSISPWDDEHVPEEIVCNKPNPGYAYFNLSGCLALQAPYIPGIIDYMLLPCAHFCQIILTDFFGGFLYLLITLAFVHVIVSKVRAIWQTLYTFFTSCNTAIVLLSRILFFTLLNDRYKVMIIARWLNTKVSYILVGFPWVETFLCTLLGFEWRWKLILHEEFILSIVVCDWVLWLFYFSSSKDTSFIENPTFWNFF